jgi:hypothetical protein
MGGPDSQKPDNAWMAALAMAVILGTILTCMGFPGLMRLPGWQACALFGYERIACPGMNDAMEVAMAYGAIL